MQGTVGQLRPKLGAGNRMDLKASKTAFLFNKISSSSRFYNKLVELRFLSKFGIFILHTPPSLLFNT